MKRKQKSKRKSFVNILALLAIAIVATGAVIAHGGSNTKERENLRVRGNYGGMMGHMMMGNMDEMHEQMGDVLESGDFQSLEELRDKWNMPIIHWVENEDDMQLAREMHAQEEGNFGTGCHG